MSRNPSLGREVAEIVYPRLLEWHGMNGSAGPVGISHRVRDGVTGSISDTVHEMMEAAGRIGAIERRACRVRVEERFSAPAMADGYERIYRTLAADDHPRTAE